MYFTLIFYRSKMKTQGIVLITYGITSLSNLKFRFGTNYAIIRIQFKGVHSITL